MNAPLWWLACFFVLALAGCFDAPQNAPDDSDADEANGSFNMWEAGLSDHYETPDVAVTRSSDERRADVAPPGDAGFIQFDQFMSSVLERYELPAASLALMQDGRLRYASGYGHTKPDGTGTVDPDTMFRMASVTKTMTRALVNLQVEQGLYDFDDPVFCLLPDPNPDCRLPLTPHPNHPVVDARIAEITVGMLVNHTAGWTNALKTDKLEIIQEMQELFDLDGMPDMWHAATFLMGTKLTNDPGTTYDYCGVCYQLAGLVAEAATGTNLQALYDAYLFRPLEIEGNIELGKAPVDERNPREPFYISGVEVPNVYNPSETVDAADGEYHLDILSSAGALIGTPEAVATVFEAYPSVIPKLLAVKPFSDSEPYYPLEVLYDNRGAAGQMYGTNALSLWAQDTQTGTGVIQAVVLFNADYINSNSGCQGACSDWTEFQVELLALMLEKAREG